MGVESFPKSNQTNEAPSSKEELSELEIDSRINEILSKLPEELGDRFLDAHKEMSLSEQYKALLELRSKRKESLETNTGSRFNPDHVSVVESYPMAVVRLLERIESSEHEQLGVGQAGRVISSVRYPNTCYKVMLPIDKIPKETIPIEDEADIQDGVASLGEVHGVRVPRVFSFINEKRARAITMERLHAVSVRDVLRGKEVLPESFNPESFFESLRKFILYINEKGYYHRDLHDGNVMIDTETGQPYVIDFGTSKFSPIEEGVYRETVPVGGRFQEIVLQSDLDNLRQTERMLKGHIGKA